MNGDKRMSADQYAEAARQSEQQHAAELAQTRARTRQCQVAAAESAARAGLVGTNVNPQAIDDVVSLVVGKTTFDEEGRPVVKDAADPFTLLTPGEYARQLVAARPHLQSGRPATAREVSEQKWDIQKATQDLAYDEEWRKADPEGRQAAWDAHLGNITEQQRLKAVKR